MMMCGLYVIFGNLSFCGRKLLIYSCNLSYSLVLPWKWILICRSQLLIDSNFWTIVLQTIVWYTIWFAILLEGNWHIHFCLPVWIEGKRGDLWNACRNGDTSIATYVWTIKEIMITLTFVLIFSRQGVFLEGALG